MKDRGSNWQIAASVILLFAIWLGALPVFGQIKQDGKGVGVKVVSELPPKEKRWALIVGIDKYEKDVSTLQGAVNDAGALKNVLVNYAGFPENQVILLTSDAADVDNLPKRENILSALGDLSQRVPPDGLLLFSFSGHGVSVGDQAFLIPSNGRITKNLSLLRSLSINVKDIQEAIQEIKVKQVLMLLDACRNEPGKGDVPNVLTDAYKEGFSFDVANSDVKAFATLYATSVGERAFEFYDKDTKQFRGYFSHAVEEALKGKAANDKGEVTLSNLINYLETTVPKKVKYDKGETQIPTANYSDSYRANQLILSVADKSENNSLSPAQIAWTKFSSTARLLLKYDYVGLFSEDLVKVTLNGKWGIIGKNGKEIILPKYDDIYSLSEGFASVSLNGKYGLIDKNGTEITLPKYDEADLFSEDLARVRLNGKEGFIDKNGKEIIALKYDAVDSFSQGLTRIKLNGKYGYIDKSGKKIILPQYDGIDLFSEGLARVKVNEKWGFIDKSGKEIIALKYDAVYPFSEGVAWVKLNGKYGLIDKNGKEIILPKYDYVDSFSEDLARVILNGKQGFIDKNGKETIPLKYDYAESFSQGLARMRLNGKEGFIDKSGKEIVALKYDYVSLFSKGIAGVKLNDKWGVIDKSGKEIIPLKYDYVNSFSEDLAGVTLNGKQGFIDKSGKEIILPKYDDFGWIDFRKEGFIGVKLNGKKGFVDIYGNEYFDF